MSRSSTPELRLQFLSGSRRGEASSFSAGPVRIGRSRDNTIVLPPDPLTTSAHHAELAVENGRWWLLDAGSTNGTYVNGARVTRHRLASGDRIALGGTLVEATLVAHRHGIVWNASIAAALVAVLAVLLSIVWSAARRPSFERVAAQASRSVFLVARQSQGRRTIVGTAFAIDRARTLATNAHVADAVAPGSGAAAVAVRGDTYETFPVRSVLLHPRWTRGSLENDVALIQLGADSPAPPLPLAPSAEIQRLQRGTQLAAFGFAAPATDVWKPRGRLVVDVVQDVRLPYVQAGLAIAPGTSGSPVMTIDGVVVAIVTAGDFVAAPGEPPHPSGTAVNWAISVSVLEDLLGMTK